MADGGAPTEVRAILRSLIDPDPRQPRRGAPEEVFDVSDIVGSIRQNGVTVPLLVEPVAEGRFRIIDGERRWIATGPEHVDLAELPCIVRDDLTADERIAIQLATYASAPLPPLREAAALKRLLDELTVPGGVPAQPGDVADRIGRPTRYVRQRLALLALVPAAAELLAGGRITLGLALALALLAPEGQGRAAAKIAAIPRDSAEPVGLNVGRFAVRAEQLALAGASWDLADPNLPGGACVRCPKQTAAQRDLFDEAPAGSECLDRACFEAKAVASHKLPRSPGEADRTDEERDDTEGVPPSSGRPPVRGPNPPREGRSSPGGASEPLPKASPKGSAAEDARLRHEAETVARQKALTKIGKAFAKRAPDEKLWRQIAGFVVRTVAPMWSGLMVEARARRGFEFQTDDAARASILATLGKASAGDCAALIVELLAAADETEKDDDVFRLACRAAKVDPAALVDEELERLRAAQVKPEPKGKAKRGAPSIWSPEVLEERAAELRRIGAFLRARAKGKNADEANALYNLAGAIEKWKPESIAATVRAAAVSHLRAMAKKVPAVGDALRGTAEAVLAGEYLPKGPPDKLAPLTPEQRIERCRAALPGICATKRPETLVTKALRQAVPESTPAERKAAIDAAVEAGELVEDDGKLVTKLS